MDNKMINERNIRLTQKLEQWIVCHKPQVLFETKTFDSKTNSTISPPPSTFSMSSTFNIQTFKIPSRVKSVSYFLFSAVYVSNIQLYLDNYMRLVLFLLSTKQPNIQEQTIQIKM